MKTIQEKKIRISKPNNNINTPAYKRVDFLRSALSQKFTDVSWYQGDEKGIAIRLISFPPFPRIKNLIEIIFSPEKIIIDYRDGWSKAILTGYGGMRKPRIITGLIVKLIELILWFKASCVITCTPGLQAWFGAKTLLIPNGSELNFNKCRTKIDLTRADLRVVCFGKFKSYGEANAKQALYTLSNRYPGKRITIDVYSNDEREVDMEHSHKNIHISRLEPVRSYKIETILKNYDIGIAIIRDPAYDFGTKIFDYVQVGLPVLDYFNYEMHSSFKEFFRGCFDTDFDLDLKTDCSRNAMAKSHDLQLLFDHVNKIT